MKTTKTLLIVLAFILYSADPVFAQPIFGPAQVISDATTASNEVKVADIDGDGVLDVLGASLLGEQFSWYKNDGTPGGLGDWVATRIHGGNLPRSITAADVDGDGDLDIFGTAAGTSGTTTHWWFVNDGTPSVANWDAVSIAQPAADTTIGRQNRAADIDGDGDVDLIGVAGAAGGIAGELISWYENNGSPLDPNWTAYRIDTTREGASVFPADVDGDGDLDVVASVTRFPTSWVGWYENNGARTNNWNFHPISDTVGRFVYVYAADLDGDLDVDIITGSSNVVAWYENDGTGTFGAAQLISNSASGAYDLKVIDLDGDADKDVVVAFATAGIAPVVWYENDGTPGGLGDWNFHTVGSATDFGLGIDVADLDGDGDLDIVTSRGNSFVWYENLNEVADLSHFHGYTLDKKKSTKLPGKLTVTLDDQFMQHAGISPINIRVNNRPKFLFTPANKNAEGISNPVDHLACYKITRKHQHEDDEYGDENDHNDEHHNKHKYRKTNVSVRNQFGDQQLRIKEVKLLCVSSVKAIFPAYPSTQVSELKIDHYTAYEIGKSTKLPEKPVVTVDDQFIQNAGIPPIETTLNKKPKYLLTPANINGEGIRNAVDHLACYEIEGKRFKAHLDVNIANQFGDQQLRVKHGKLLCAPSTVEFIE